MRELSLSPTRRVHDPAGADSSFVVCFNMGHYVFIYINCMDAKMRINTPIGPIFGPPYLIFMSPAFLVYKLGQVLASQFQIQQQQQQQAAASSDSSSSRDSFSGEF